MKDFDVEERVSQAIQHFKSGYNCSQSVFMAYSDLFDLDQELAKMISVSFGGGMGRMLRRPHQYPLSYIYYHISMSKYFGKFSFSLMLLLPPSIVK